MPQVSLIDEYQPESWILDFRTLMGMKDQEAVPQSLREILYKRHPDSPNAEEYEKRFAAAYMYLLNHMSEFDVPACAVVSSTGSAILTDSLFYSLYLHFIQVPIEAIDFAVPVEAFIRSAQKADEKYKTG
jgi:hypothetical protein